MGRAAPSLIPASRDQAAAAFRACIGLDPEGRATPESAAAAGESFRLATEAGAVVYTLQMGQGACWIVAAAGTGTGMTESGLEAVEGQARAAGCRVVGFQTIRPGLVRKAQRVGYSVAGQVGRGVILKKSIA